MTEHNLPNEDDAPWLDCMDGFKQLTKQQVDGVFSPAAQAVFWAFNSEFSWIEDGVPGPQFKAIAAALRAAADQVVPENVNYFKSLNVRRKLLAIAAELEELPND